MGLSLAICRAPTWEYIYIYMNISFCSFRDVQG